MDANSDRGASPIGFIDKKSKSKVDMSPPTAIPYRRSKSKEPKSDATMQTSLSSGQKFVPKRPRTSHGTYSDPEDSPHTSYSRDPLITPRPKTGKWVRQDLRPTKLIPVRHTSVEPRFESPYSRDHYDPYESYPPSKPNRKSGSNYNQIYRSEVSPNNRDLSYNRNRPDAVPNHRDNRSGNPHTRPNRAGFYF